MTYFQNKMTALCGVLGLPMAALQAAGVAVFAVLWSVCVINFSAGHIGSIVDDGHYFVSALSLEQGSGYRLISRPGEPSETRYPIGTSLIAAAAIKLLIPAGGSDFNKKFLIARWVVIVSGIVFLFATIAWINRLGVGRFYSSLIGCATLLHPEILHVSPTMMSDLPFAAVCALIFARWLSPSRHLRKSIGLGAVIDGLMIGLAFEIRSIGIVFIVGSVLFYYLEGQKWRWRQIFYSWLGIAIPILISKIIRHDLPHDPLSYTYTSDLIATGFGQFILIIRSNFTSYLLAMAHAVNPALATRSIQSHEVLYLFIEFTTSMVLLFGLVQWFHKPGTYKNPLFIIGVLTLGTLTLWTWYLGLRPWIQFIPAFVLLAGLGVKRLVGTEKSLIGVAIIYAMMALAIGRVASLNLIKQKNNLHLGEALSYLHEKTEKDAVIITFFPELVYLYTKRQGIPIITELNQRTENLEEWKNIMPWMAKLPSRQFYFLWKTAFPNTSNNLELRLARALQESSPFELTKQFENKEYQVVKILQ